MSEEIASAASRPRNDDLLRMEAKMIVKTAKGYMVKSEKEIKAG